MAIENGIQSLTVVSPEVQGREPIARAERPGESFASQLGKAVGSLDQLHVDADKEVSEVAMGGGNLHEMAISLEKADIGLRLATKVRNKLIEAYQEIMRMSV